MPIVLFDSHLSCPMGFLVIACKVQVSKFDPDLGQVRQKTTFSALDTLSREASCSALIERTKIHDIKTKLNLKKLTHKLIINLSLTYFNSFAKWLLKIETPCKGQPFKRKVPRARFWSGIVN